MPYGDPVVGSLTIRENNTYPWPTWWPNTFAYPATYTYSVGTDYANDVEVTRGEHDAVLRFYYVDGAAHRFVKEITIPLALLDGELGR